MKVKSAEFVISSNHYSKCPKPDLSEFAFVGRSNVGKSSLINQLVNRKSLAKTSSTPGKTQLINHFLINNEWYLVDLPGYGWAKVSKVAKMKWEKMIRGYILNRKNLASLIVLIDIRLDPQPIDSELIQWLGEMGIPFIIVFTKADKLSKGKVQKSVDAYQRHLRETWEELPKMITSSAKTGIGKDQILDYIRNTLMSMTL